MHARRALECSQPDQIARHLRSFANLGENYFWHEHRHKLVHRALPSGTRSLLDFGCGEGLFLRELMHQRSAIDLYGYDIIDYTNGSLDHPSPSGRRVKLLSQWPPRHIKFDVITIMDVLEHIEDDCGTLEGLREMVAPEGVIIITVPAFHLFWSEWDRRLVHFRRYNAGSLQSVLAKAGFHTLYCSYFFSYLCLPALWRRFVFTKKQDVLYPAVAPIHYAANFALRLTGACERAMMTAVRMPLGTSLMAVATRGERR